MAVVYNAGMSPFEPTKTEFDKEKEDATTTSIDGLYDQLRDLAWMLLRHQTVGSITPTDLVHEAFVKLAKGDSGFSVENKEHAVRSIVRTMRHVLIDRCRKRKAARREASRTEKLLDWNSVAERCPEPWLAELDEALDRLATVDARSAEIIQLRFFGGLTSEEIGQVLGITDRTVRRDWGFAQAWLTRELSSE